jgi:hypothetical protein
LNVCLEEEILPRRPDFDILMWWKLNSVKYPTLQAIARDILAILDFDAKQKLYHFHLLLFH